MSRKRTTILLILIIFIIGIIGVLYGAFKTSALEKTISLRGYEISIPKKWSNDSKGNFYNKKGEQAGRFLLIDEPVNEENAIDFCGEEITGEINREVNDKNIKYVFTSGKGETEMYFVSGLRNPEPYGAAVVIYQEFVKKGLGKKIAETFKQPVLGKNPPDKKIEKPQDEKTVIKIEFEDGSTSVKNSNLFSEFSKKLSAGENYGINVITYREKDGNRIIADWKYLESSNGTGYMYTYYEANDNIYSYDNNATEFLRLIKNINEEENTTSYSIFTNEENELKLMSFPLNRYRDNAEELVALKTTNATDAHIQLILEKILDKKELLAVSLSVNDDTLELRFGKEVEADKIKAHSHSAIIFSLADNIKTINIKYIDNEFFFTKEQIDKSTEREVDSVANDEKSFVEYTEEIDKKNTNDGQVVYSGTVVISYNTLVTHPKTGEKVAVGPYAEDKGFGQYLGKPINCVIKRNGSGYVATATCGGRHLTTYPLENESRLQWAINMIKAYS